MSAGASHYAYLNESDSYNASASSVAHIAIPVGSVSGGLATWSLDRDAFALTTPGISSYGRFTETTKYALSGFGGTFRIAASPPLVVNNVAVTAQLADVEVAAAMKALRDQRAERTRQALSAFLAAKEKLAEAKADGLTAVKLIEREDEKNAAKREWKKARRHRNNAEARFEAADTAAKAAVDVLEQAVESYTCTLETVICNVLIDSLQQIVTALNSDERLVLPQQ